MKKTFLFVLLMCCFAGVAKAQNIQLHYDLGRAMYNSLEDLMGYYYSRNV